METEGGHIATVQDALAVHFNAKGVGGIVDDFQAILVCNSLDGVHIHRLAVAVYGHNGRGLGRNGSLNLVGIYATGLLLNIHENRTAPIPPDAVSGGHKAVGRGDDLSSNTQGLQGCQQRQGTVGEQADVRNL